MKVTPAAGSHGQGDVLGGACPCCYYKGQGRMCSNRQTGAEPFERSNPVAKVAIDSSQNGMGQPPSTSAQLNPQAAFVSD